LHDQAWVILLSVVGRAFEIIMRTKGSCRFAAYYKVEWRDERMGVWKVIQKSHASLDGAKASMTKGKTCRVIKVSEKGMEVLP
jgi:hypothetical protein